MPTGTFTLVQTFTTICCPTATCGVTFAINDEYRDRRVADKQGFYCPNGHTMTYGENEADRLRIAKRNLQKTVEFLEEDIRIEQRRLANERKRHASTKGQLTKTRKRVANGVCPCCHRSFAQLQRHMTNKHPDFVASTA